MEILVGFKKKKKKKKFITIFSFQMKKRRIQEIFEWVVTTEKRIEE